MGTLLLCQLTQASTKLCAVHNIGGAGMLELLAIAMSSVSRPNCAFEPEELHLRAGVCPV